MKKTPETFAPSANKNTSSANNYNIDLIELALGQAEIDNRLASPYCVGGSHRSLAVAICWNVAKHSPPYPHPKTLPEILTFAQDACGYSLQVIQAAIDFLTRAEVIIQRFNGNDVVLTIRAGVH